jgi:hypothetical protein
MKYRCRKLGVLAALLLLAGCLSMPSRSELVPSASAAPVPASAGKNAGPFLYVAGTSISRYALGGSKPIRSTPTPYNVQSSLALDSNRNLVCESNGNPSFGQLVAYDARTLKLVGSLNTYTLTSIVADQSGYVYGAASDIIEVFRPGCTNSSVP